MLNSKEYWKKRSLKDAVRRVNLTETFINSTLKKYYNKALIDIKKEIEELYNSFADKENITLLEAKRKINTASFTGKDYNGLINLANTTKDKQLLDYINVLSKKGQITRLELLNLNINNTLLTLFGKEEVNIYKHLANTYKESYFKSIYNMQTYFKIGVDFINPSETVIKKAVTQDWLKSNYSKRISEHKKRLAQDLKQHINIGLIQGSSIDKMASKIEKDMNVSLNNAIRLVRTETNYIHNQATLDTYENYAYIKQYRYLATLDFKTSRVCKELDGKIFYVTEAKVGENYPPMHPNCRATTVPYDFEDEQISQRFAKMADGKAYSVPDNIAYNDWFNNLSEDEKGKMRLNSKKQQNYSLDIQQFERYKKILGKDAPSNIKKFKELKYDNEDKWKKLKSLYSQNLYKN